MYWRWTTEMEDNELHTQNEGEAPTPTLGVRSECCNHKVTMLLRDRMCTPFPQQVIAGGFGQEKLANAEVQKICEQVKPQAEQKAGKKFACFKATSFCTQTVAGTNYFIKVHVDGNDYIHMRVFRSLPSEGSKISLNSIQTGKTKHDPIVYF